MGGQQNRPAAAGSQKVLDEGFRRLQTKGDATAPPHSLSTRCAKVSRPLMAVVDMVDKGNVVVFAKDRSFCVNQKTGRQFEFERVAGGWDLTLDLEAPKKANEVRSQMLAEFEAIKVLEAPKNACAVHVHVGPGAGTRAEVLDDDTRGQEPYLHDAGPFGRRPSPV